MDKYINLIISGLLIPILPLLTIYLISLFKKKIDELQTKINNENINKYISIAENAIETSVISITQTLVDAAKKNGTWTTELALQAFNDAKTKAIAIMGSAVKEEIMNIYGDFNTWIDSKIEFYVNQSK